MQINKIAQLINREIKLISAGLKNKVMDIPEIDLGGVEDVTGPLKKRRVDEIKWVKRNNATNISVAIT
jgi:hypothetical protein